MYNRQIRNLEIRLRLMLMEGSGGSRSDWPGDFTSLLQKTVRDDRTWKGVSSNRDDWKWMDRGIFF